MTTQNTEYMGTEGYELIGAAFEVHGELGGGMSEEIYQVNFGPLDKLEWKRYVLREYIPPPINQLADAQL